MNWVSKCLYLERKIKKLEETIEHLTSHIQVDEDGNVVIEANKFDVSANTDVKIKSFNDININCESRFQIDSNDVLYLNADAEIELNGKDGFVNLVSGTSALGVNSNDNIVLYTDKSIELKPTDRLTSTKTLEVVE